MTLKEESYGSLEELEGILPSTVLSSLCVVSSLQNFFLQKHPIDLTAAAQQQQQEVEE